MTSCTRQFCALLAAMLIVATDGRYFTTGRRQVLEWARDGSYVRAVGKDGGGPGEFGGKGGVASARFVLAARNLATTTAVADRSFRLGLDVRCRAGQALAGAVW